MAEPRVQASVFFPLRPILREVPVEEFVGKPVTNGRGERLGVVLSARSARGGIEVDIEVESRALG